MSGDTYVIMEITGDKTQIDFALARLEPLGIADITTNRPYRLEIGKLKFIDNNNN